MDQHTGIREAVRDVADPSALMSRVVRGALTFVPQAEGAVVELVDAQGLLTYVSAAGSLEPYVGTCLRLDGSLSGRAMATRSTLRCDNAETDGRVDHRACREMGIASMVCVPLVHGRESVGVLKVCSSRTAAFGEADAAALSELAGFVSAVVKSASDVALIMAGLLSGADERGSEASVGTDDEGLVSASDAVATFVADVLRPGIVANLETENRIETLLSTSAFTMVYQPIVDLRSGRVAGVEALARFPGSPTLPTAAWFADADAVGLGTQLELAAVEAALAVLGRLPEGVALAVNAGPGTIGEPWFHAMLDAAGPRRIVAELTEHTEVVDYRDLSEKLKALRKLGVRLSVDDTGAGISSLTHILNLAPDFIKLDIRLTKGIDFDPVRKSLATALVTFANESGAAIIAEGIETAGELETLQRLGAHYGQGYFLGMPRPVEALSFSSPLLLPPAADPAALHAQSVF